MTGDPLQRLHDSPITKWTGMRLVAQTAARAELELPARSEFTQAEGVVHGGMLAMLADSAAVFLLWPTYAASHWMTSIDFQMHFLAAAKPMGEPLRAVATLLRAGSSVAVVESEVFQGSVRCCKGTFTYLLRLRQKDA
ncbi:MAG: PaaI family thioesterase [Planctomycetota bacterium]